MPVAVYDGKHPAARLPHGHSSLAAVLQAVCDVMLRPDFARLQFRIPVLVQHVQAPAHNMVSFSHGVRLGGRRIW
jgi:hypothetical protein